MNKGRQIGAQQWEATKAQRSQGGEGVNRAQILHLLLDLGLLTATPLKVERRDGKHCERLSDSGNTELLNVFLLLGVILSA